MSSYPKASTAVQQALDACTSDPKKGVSGLVFASINKKGEIIQTNASGKRGVNTNKAMDVDTIFCIFSCTKLLTTIVCLQLVEQGKLSLDDHKSLYKLCPELEKVQVLQDDLTLRPKQHDITLRMLLTHTAGFGYEFFNEKLRDYARPAGYDVFHGDAWEILQMPLVNEPGTKWEYGINIDWAGLAAERAGGKKLNELMQDGICKPLGLTNTTMFPSTEMKAQLAAMHQKYPDGKLVERDHLLRRSLFSTTPEEQDRIFNSGGAGCFSKPTEYIPALLNDGTSPSTGYPILSSKTVDEMFKNQIPQFPNFGHDGLPGAKPDMTNPIPDMYPQDGNPPQGWGLSFFMTIEPGVTGRGRNTGWWAGISNLFYWVDREKGVAGMIASQIMPFGDMSVLGTWFGCEKAIYDNI
ncbi:beta-lactamase/transpeptidase-like protein [Pseudovirgaria hyperparasitica]|uniref:Beta-lactamase/transpeptidase-like protein n=1 Tax=Pseudovirgaria hyperparasitica TaxID=470096 RepID=A0A6A6VWA7_9PEZI|nr:beta-lactamase/transpeptidase-like protein [Pseudovirgaria hyperparasitica]KAF2754872.1 beta-lactamase/transpeptidase-like protein [Pseudovirgaria hyperparasitica]